MKALVVKSTGSWYTVLPLGGGDAVLARLRGSLRLIAADSTAPVVVGDTVECVAATEGEWVIESVDERRNCLVRRATNLSRQKHIIASNVDRMYVVATLMQPSTPLEFIDRVLAGAAAYGVDAKIVVNKIDIARPNDYFEDIYSKAGYQIIKTSTVTGEGLDELREDINGKTVLFTGNSGVGKSSLINALDPTLGARVGEISSYHSKGKHTTTFSEIFPFADGAYLIDTPGIKGFGLVDVAKEEIYHYFCEIMHYSTNCAYYNCTHTHEPNCAVQQAVEDGKIAPERYESYLKMIQDDQPKYR